MAESAKQSSLRQLRQIPGVGEKIAEDFWELGLHHVADLKNQDAEELYERLCFQQGKKVDRCMLYVFRCAVYYASNKNHDPDMLKWWNWKDRQ